MSLQRRATDFRGWQSEVDYLASEAERQKRVERAIELHRQMEDEVRPLAFKWKLTLGIICFGLAGYLFTILWMSL